MTDKNLEILTRIQDFAAEVLGDYDPQKTKVSTQLEALKPVMNEIAKEKDMDLEDIFILYMDLVSEAGVTADTKMKEEFSDPELSGFFQGSSQ